MGRWLLPTCCRIARPWSFSTPEMHVRARHGVLPMDSFNFERFLERLAKQEQLERARELGDSAQDARKRGVELERQQQAEERARRREIRNRPCGAKTRAGHPCRRK